MRISASVSSLQLNELATSVSQLDTAGVEFFHLDSVENREIFDFARRLRGLTRSPFDLHLITSDPVKYWDDIRAAGIAEITIQLETLRAPLFVPEDLRDRVGIAVLANRPAAYFKPYAKTALTLLLMTTTPGYSGGKFQQEQFANIMRYRILYPHLPITVDGGVIPEVAAVLGFMGIGQIVCGSFLFKGHSIADSVHQLRHGDLSGWRLDEVLLPEPEILHAFSLRIPEIVSFIDHTGECRNTSVKGEWLDAIGAKSVTSHSLPFSVVFVDERITLDVLQERLSKLESPVEMAITLNSNAEVTGVCCLSAYKG